MQQKLLTVVVPCYNSQAYMEKCINSLLPGGEQMEIVIVNDGSTDKTPAIADAFACQYPKLVSVIHQENGGHGDAVMAGLRNAKGLFFKVVDSDDWVDTQSLHKVLQALEGLVSHDQAVDLMICNYIYDKAGSRNKRVIRYGNVLKERKILGWDDVKRFRIGQYILMHAAIYRTALLHDCGLSLPKHTFYVDNLYAYVPLTAVQKLYYLNVDLYHYYIGREDQSVQEQIMIKRIDQQLLVNKLMAQAVDLRCVANRRQRAYMRNYLEIVTVVSSVLLIKSNTKENLLKKEALWQTLKEEATNNYRLIRRRPLGAACCLHGLIGRKLVMTGYEVSRRIFGYN